MHLPFRSVLIAFFALLFAAGSAEVRAAEPVQPAVGSGLRIGLFDVDATPPVGSWLAYDPVTNRWDLGLRARGVVLAGAGDPIVLCAVDWIGIANESHDLFRERLARAASTSSKRVTVHTLHQHDAPDCDFSAEKILKAEGLDARQYESGFQRTVLEALEAAVRGAMTNLVPLTDVGVGAGRVHEVASNRRLLGPDGKVKTVRWTASPDPAARAEPEGLIDPMVSLVTFWNQDKPVAALSYYATHPQSYYRTGFPNPDFPGLARFLRQVDAPKTLHVHFNGAGGNIGAGKYNDGSPENRAILARRVAAGMKEAWDKTVRHPITAGEVAWATVSVALPLPAHLTAEKLEAQMKGREATFVARGGPAKLAWVRRVQSGYQNDIGCLRLGSARVLHLPGELFVEYQLAAKARRPDLFVAMAAYGDYAPGYIGTEIAYDQGGYETGPTASNVAPTVEKVLMRAIYGLLDKP